MATSGGGGGGTPASGPAPPHSSWSDILPEIIGLVLSRLHSVADRARLRCVCRSWHNAVRLHPPAVPPLPLIVYPDFMFDSLFTDGVTGAVRQIPRPLNLMHAEFPRCVGSFDGWLVCALRDIYDMNYRAVVLMNPFSDVTYLLPNTRTFHHHVDVQRSVPIINGHGAVTYAVGDHEYPVFLHNVVMSASPDSASSCIIAAMFDEWKGEANLALCRPGTTSWCMCVGNCITMPSDIEFYDGKLYLLCKWTAGLFAFVLGQHNGCIPVVSRVEHCVFEKLPASDSCGQPYYNLVQSRGKLLLLVRYYMGRWDDITQVKVFALDFATNPYRWREMKSLDGESIFISSCSRNSFCASQYNKIEDDHIYFVDHFFFREANGYSHKCIVYNMRDGTTKRILLGRTLEQEGLPIWFFPSQ